MTYLFRFLILEGRMNRISPDKYVEVLFGESERPEG